MKIPAVGIKCMDVAPGIASKVPEVQKKVRWKMISGIPNPTVGLQMAPEPISTAYFVQQDLSFVPGKDDFERNVDISLLTEARE